MKVILKKLVQNKIFYVFLFLTIILFPGTLYKTAQSESRAILTSVALDKEGEELEITSTVLTSGGGTKFADNLQIVSAKGKNVSECLEKISSSLGKMVGLAHTEFIVLGDGVIEDDAYKYLNYFISTNNLTTNAIIINSKVAKDVLTADIENPVLANITAKQIVQYDSHYHQSVQTNLDKFFLDYFSSSGLTILPRLEVVESERKGDSESGGENSSNDSTSSSSSENSQSQSKSKTLENNGKLVLLKKGKLVAELDGEQNKMLYLLKNPKYKGTLQIENVNDEFAKNGDVVLEVVRKNNIMSTGFVDGKPHVHYNMFLVLKMDEYVTDNENINTINSTESKVTKELKAKVVEKIKTETAELFEFCKSNGVDMFGIYKKLNAFHHSDLKEYLKTHNIDDLLNDVYVAMDITIRGKI